MSTDWMPGPPDEHSGHVPEPDFLHDAGAADLLTEQGNPFTAAEALLHLT
jgi:hypothetical protein